LNSQKGIYGFIMEVCNIDNRDYAKELFQVWLAQKKNPRGKAKILFAGMKEAFPILTAYLREIRNEQDNNNGPAIQNLLQNEEAAVIIPLQRSLQALGVPCLTVHDCLLVK